VAGRALRKTEAFLAAAQGAAAEVSFLLEAIAGAEFVLARSPEHGMAVPGSRFYSWPIHPTEGVTFKVIYTFDAREVVFNALYPAVAPPGFRSS
jgi:hypothetical protein